LPNRRNTLSWGARFAQFLRSIFGGLLLCVVFFASVAGAKQAFPNNFLIGSVALGSVALFVSVVIHELGHVVATRAIGWRVHIVSVFTISYLPARRVFSRAIRIGGRDIGGFVFATPQLPSGWVRGAFLLVLGGAVANLLASGFAMTIAHFNPNSPWITALAGDIGIVCLIFGIANLVPHWGPSEARNDGALLIDIFRGKSIAGENPVGMWLVGESIDGSPRLDSEVISLFEREPSLDPAAQLQLHVWLLLKTGQVKRLAEVLDAASAAENSKGTAHLADHAFAVVLAQRDATKAAAILERVPVEQQKNFNYWRAKMVLMALKGDYAEARQMIFGARAAARGLGLTPDPDDERLFAAVERGEALPFSFDRQPA
jgi:hypothetical protein